MNELELKYGCNPNQKPSRIFMKDGSDLPIEGAVRQARATLTSSMRSTLGSSCAS